MVNEEIQSEWKKFKKSIFQNISQEINSDYEKCSSKLSKKKFLRRGQINIDCGGHKRKQVFCICKKSEEEQVSDYVGCDSCCTININ